MQFISNTVCGNLQTKDITRWPRHNQDDILNSVNQVVGLKEELSLHHTDANGPPDITAKNTVVPFTEVPGYKSMHKLD
ncbi:hypothetical protein I9W82_000433 [Candida metapsilosis]|uniref:Uncharacterized protein n=1 Tax=Candida metapsilosis TaxID=273372 RepID=A0A8H8DCA8_9ASCO|nr:hypothetical protein I9W82_000433 [Candida metapsilosis]